MAGKGGSLGKNGRMKAGRIKVVHLARGKGRGQDRVQFSSAGKGRMMMSNNKGEGARITTREANKRIKAAKAAGFTERVPKKK